MNSMCTALTSTHRVENASTNNVGNDGKLHLTSEIDYRLSSFSSSKRPGNTTYSCVNAYSGPIDGGGRSRNSLCTDNSLLNKDSELWYIVQHGSKLPNQKRLRQFVWDDSKLRSWRTCTSATTLNYRMASLLSYLALNQTSTASPATPSISACTLLQWRKTTLTFL